MGTGVFSKEHKPRWNVVRAGIGNGWPRLGNGESPVDRPCLLLGYGKTTYFPQILLQIWVFKLSIFPPEKKSILNYYLVM